MLRLPNMMALPAAAGQPPPWPSTRTSANCDPPVNITRDSTEVCSGVRPAATDSAPNDSAYAPTATPMPAALRSTSRRRSGNTGSGYPPQHQRAGGFSGGSDDHGAVGGFAGRREPGGVVGAQLVERIAGRHPIAGPAVQDHAGGGRDRVLLARPAGAQPPGGHADAVRVDGGHIT